MARNGDTYLGLEFKVSRFLQKIALKPSFFSNYYKIMAEYIALQCN